MIRISHLSSGAFFVEADTYRAAYDIYGRIVGENPIAPTQLLPFQMRDAEHDHCLCSLKREQEIREREMRDVR